MWPLRDVNGTHRVDSQKAVPVIHKTAFPDPFPFQSVTAPNPGSAVPLREIGGGRERPPFLVPGSGTGALRNSHLRNAPWGGRSRLIDPCGKAPAKIPDDLLRPSKASIPPCGTTWSMNDYRL